MRRTAVPFVYRYYPTVREGRDRVRSGRTGPIRHPHTLSAEAARFAMERRTAASRLAGPHPVRIADLGVSQYSSRRLNHSPVSLRPSGARSSHWYIAHTASRPRA